MLRMISMDRKILFHVDKGPEDLNIAISNVGNVFNALSCEECSLVMVVNGPAIRFMKKDGEHAEKLEQLARKGLSLRVCNNALNGFNILPEELNAACEIVPAGILEIADLQREGFAYIKP